MILTLQGKGGIHLKLLDNIFGLLTIAGGIGRLKEQKKAIDRARLDGNTELEQAKILEACQIWSTHIVKKFEVDYTVINPENLPKEGPVVFIANHQSYADILSFLYNIKNHQLSFIAKDTLGSIPVFGKWVLRIRGIFIERGDVRASLRTINEGVDYLKQGFSLVIFPEGTRSRSSEMAEFKPGSFKLATKAKVPIVPVTLDGGYRTYEQSGSVTKGCHIDFMVHPAIETKDMSRAELAELPQTVEKIIRDGLETLHSAPLNI